MTSAYPIPPYRVVLGLGDGKAPEGYTPFKVERLEGRNKQGLFLSCPTPPTNSFDPTDQDILT